MSEDAKGARGPVTRRGLPRGLEDHAVPAGLAILSAVAFGEGVRLILAGTSAHQSGPPGVFLCLVAVLLLSSTLVATLSDRRGAAPPAVVSDSPCELRQGSEEEVPTLQGGGTAPLWRAIGLMVFYAFALPWVGFALTTGIFLVIYLAWVAGYPWWKSAIYGVLIDTAAVVLFNQAGVVLPSGAYGF